MAYYGLEVELEFQDQDDCERYYEDIGFPTADLTAERDGSLDDECGAGSHLSPVHAGRSARSAQPAA